MKHPSLEVDLAKLEDNLSVLTKKLKQANLSVMGVTKVFCADPTLVNVYAEHPGIDYLADSRIDNIKKYPVDGTKPSVLLRIPMLSELEDVVSYVDYCQISEIKTIQQLNQVAKAYDKVQKIILMFDLGDLREGIFEDEEAYEALEVIDASEHIQLAGIGVNLTCYGAIIPDYKVLSKLSDWKEYIESTYPKVELEIISGGNSSSIYLLDEGQSGLPEGVNNLRIGESFVLGDETAYSEMIPNMHDDIFTLRAEIVEYRDKPSMPIGNVGVDAFGGKPTFEDKGIMRRGILAIGRQDVDHENMTPRDERIEILGASSDHLIIDFTQAKDDYQLGDTVEFDVSYGALLSSYTSEYVTKVYKK